MSDFVDYEFKISGTTPSEIPMARLAMYLAEYARLLGSQEHVHFGRITESSAKIHALAPPECVPVISPRLRNIAIEGSHGHGAWMRLNELLGEDGWTAKLPLPRSAEIIDFPGHTRPARAIRTVSQPTTVQGRLIRLEGAGDRVYVGLDIDGTLSAGITVCAPLDQQLAAHWHKYVSLSGEGRWKRDDSGRWILDRLNAQSFEPLDNSSLAEVLDRVRTHVVPGSGHSLLAAVNELRRA